MSTKILAIAGSLRARSLNRSLLNAFVEVIGDRATVEWADIGSVPLYNGDLDGDEKPASVTALRNQVEAADGVLIATPEYNYGIPGVLKNAIDWVSRPAYRSPMAHKPTGIVGASMSPIGSARAQAHLRQVLAGMVTPVFPRPEFLAGAAHTKFDDSGALTDAKTKEFIVGYVDAFLEWIDKVS